MKKLDARGFSCPIPLLKTKDALASCDEVLVTVDEPAARENITKFAKSQNCSVDCSESNSEWTLHIRKL
jgi:TusA-related sulfurtransferase